MISLDEVNEEWKKQDTRLDEFRTKAKLMHDTLIKEIEQSEYDLYQREEVDKIDNLANISDQLVKNDAKLRTTLKGPTIVKEKFHSSYWKHFNDERNLLEDISRKQFDKSQQTKRLTKSKSRSSILRSKSSLHGHELVRQSRSYAVLKGDYINHNWKSTIFASPTQLQNDFDHETKYFDHHLLGRNNSVDQLAKLSGNMKDQKKLKQLSETNSTFDPNGIGVAAVKGGAITLSPQRPKGIDSITKTCDIPDLSNTLKSIPGGTFAHSDRFPHTTAPRITTTQSTLPLNSSHSLVPNESMPFTFPCARRFSSEEEERSHDLLATPGPGTYSVRIDA